MCQQHNSKKGHGLIFILNTTMGENVTSNIRTTTSGYTSVSQEQEFKRTMCTGSPVSSFWSTQISLSGTNKHANEWVRSYFPPILISAVNIHWTAWPVNDSTHCAVCAGVDMKAIHTVVLGWTEEKHQDLLHPEGGKVSFQILSQMRTAASWPVFLACWP